LKIIYVNHGLGNNFGDSIELNKHLPDYPEIHDAVLKHELGHTDKLFSWKDLKLDLIQSDINSFDVFKFMIRHPLSFTQLLPFYWTRKHGFVYDINLIIYLLFFLGIISLAFII
jgi:hypothetical protein